MRGPDSFVPFLLAGAIAIVLMVLYQRYRNLQMLHQERMAALEKGTAVPAGHMPGPWSPRVYLLRGLIWSFSGAAVIICMLGITSASQKPEGAEVKFWRAKGISRSMEISLEQAQQLVEKDSRTSGVPSAVALLGLIPMGVGLAYLLYFYTDDSRQKPSVVATDYSFGKPTIPQN